MGDWVSLRTRDCRQIMLQMKQIAKVPLTELGADVGQMLLPVPNSLYLLSISLCRAVHVAGEAGDSFLTTVERPAHALKHESWVHSL